ncbi:MAG: radical SAM protein, partial [Clostridia bacterium]|nr:radical SAM protein [Clostridia bacterium]
MKLIINNPKYEHLTREIITAYIPKLKIETTDAVPEVEDYTQADIRKNGDCINYSVTVRINGISRSARSETHSEQKLHLSKLLSDILKQFCGIDLPWGILTGIRPAKMVREMYADGMSFDEIYNVFCNDYDVHPEKALLAIDVAKREIPLIDTMSENGVSIYIGIPFCPTRCLYCSFTSQSIKFSNTLVEPYMSALFKEIDYMSRYLHDADMPIETIYIGGGTPTALDEYNLAQLMDKISSSFDMSYLREYTVEAGRPDTITAKKLKTLKAANVSRISINPQTMNQKTLDIIGRRHTPEDIIS